MDSREALAVPAAPGEQALAAFDGPRGSAHRRVLLLIAAGFTLVGSAVVGFAYISLESSDLMRENASAVIRSQLATIRLIDRIQDEQAVSRMILDRLVHQSVSVGGDRILERLDDTERGLRAAVDTAVGLEDERLWRALLEVSNEFAEEARLLLGSEPPQPKTAARLLSSQERVVEAVQALLEAGHQRARTDQGKMAARADALRRQTVGFLAGSLILGLIGAGGALWGTSSMLRRIASQGEDLSRVSLRLLERQEDTARRISHELHDELGQALTAIKLTLSRSRDQATRQEATAVVDNAVESVRQMSQLLYPRVLDDLGMDGALRWLCERFQVRTGVSARVDANLGRRLPRESRTHLFRIAQEALTNVSRHAEATTVLVALRAEGNRVVLTVEDDGVGLGGRKEGGLGLLGMRTRAQLLGGDLRVRSGKGRGTSVEASAPIGENDESED